MILNHSDFIAEKSVCEINLASLNRRTQIIYKGFVCKIIEFKVNDEGNEKGNYTIYYSIQTLVRQKGAPQIITLGKQM